MAIRRLSNTTFCNTVIECVMLHIKSEQECNRGQWDGLNINAQFDFENCYELKLITVFVIKQFFGTIVLSARSVAEGSAYDTTIFKVNRVEAKLVVVRPVATA